MNQPRAEMRSGGTRAGAARRATGLALALLVAVTAGAYAAPRFFRLQSAVRLKGPVQGWDYLSFDPARGYLFVNRRAQGVTVFDTRAGRVVAHIAHTGGADSTTLVPALDRGFTANRDGSTTVFALSTLKYIARYAFGTSADAGFFEPVTHQLMFTMGDSHALAFVDPRSGKRIKRLAMASGQLEAAAADGQGSIFVNERDRDRVARIDARTDRVTEEWPTTPCHEPVGMAYDAQDQRLFLGCRGDHPVLVIMDARTGRVLASHVIGRGNDGVIYDARRRRIFTANGVDGNLVVLRQAADGSCQLEQAVTTRPGARTMAFDPATGRLFLDTAEGAVDPARKILVDVAPFYPNVYFPNTLSVLTYGQP